MRRLLVVLALAVAAATPAAAQGLPAAGSLDKFMKDSAAQSSQKELQGLIASKRAGKPARKPKTAKAPKHAPIAATDFTPSGGHPTVEMFITSSKFDAARAQQLRAVFDGAFAGLEQLMRPNSVASGMGFALGVSIEIANEVELPEADVRELVSGINDMLAASGEFKKLGSPERQMLYETFVMTGALLSIMKSGGESDAAMKTQSQDMARNVISQLSGLTAK